MVQNQTVAVVDRANWHGDGTSSGLIGLAWPSITQAVQGAQGPVVQQGPVTAGSDTKTNKPAKIAYDPVFFTMKKQGLVESYFSMAINRPEEGPGCAIDRKRKRINEMLGAALQPEVARAISIARHNKQKTDVAECNGNDDPALQHANPSPGRSSAPGSPILHAGCVPREV